MRQPSPYGGTANVLPVTSFESAPARDSEGRPLAYDQDSRSGRAYVAGENPTALDKIPDYPTWEGVGNCRSGETVAGSVGADGMFQDSGLPLGAAFGSGRLIWADAEDLFTWDPISSHSVRKPLGDFKIVAAQDSIIAKGWRTYLRLDQGLAVHHGLTGAISLLLREHVSSVCSFDAGVAAAVKGNIWVLGPDSSQSMRGPGFEVERLVGQNGRLVAIGPGGEISTWEGENWAVQSVVDPLEKVTQVWIVNDRVGYRTTLEGRSTVHYPGSLSFSVATDAPMSLIPGRSGFEGHRLLGFVGGAEPSISVYHPGESSGIQQKRPLGVGALGATLAVIRRTPQDSSIIVAATDTARKRVVFTPLRDSSVTLPGPIYQPAGTIQTRFIPHTDGVMILSFDGKRCVVNNASFPL